MKLKEESIKESEIIIDEWKQKDISHLSKINKLEEEVLKAKLEIFKIKELNELLKEEKSKLIEANKAKDEKIDQLNS